MTRFHTKRDPQTGETIHVPFTSEEEAQRDAEEAAWMAGKVERDKAAFNAPIQAQIAILEAKMLRPMRDLRRADAIGDVPADTVLAAKTKIKNIDDQIIALRAQLQP